MVNTSCIDITPSLAADLDLPEINCPELTEKTADAITDTSIHELFVSTQLNNIDLCTKSAFQ